MLYEDQVVEAVARFLSAHGWHIESRVTSKQHGDDLVATKDARRLLVEAKGETSSDPTTSRYGSEFSLNQVGTHVGVAVLRSLRWVSRGDVDAAIALPDNERHRRKVGEVSVALHRAGIGVLWVSPDMSVRLDSPWEA